MEIFVGAVTLLFIIGFLAVLREIRSNKFKKASNNGLIANNHQTCIGITGLDGELDEANRQYQDRLLWMNAPGHEHLR
jgi:hypothetical protein